MRTNSFISSICDCAYVLASFLGIPDDLEIVAVKFRNHKSSHTSANPVSGSSTIIVGESIVVDMRSPGTPARKYTAPAAIADSTRMPLSSMLNGMTMVVSIGRMKNNSSTIW